MYDTLRPELLTANVRQRQAMQDDPTTVVSWDLFRLNPFPYLELRKPFIIGTANKQWKMTIGHYFARLCWDRGLLNKVYTQNIDGIDYQTGIPSSLIVPAHGSLGRCTCEYCGKDEDMEWFIGEMKTKIKDIYGIEKKKEGQGEGEGIPAESTHIKCRKCKKNGLKPSTVLYGRNLPAAFFESMQRDLPQTDLLFIVGTSLVVYPAASIPEEVSPSCKRVLVNAEPAGGFTHNSNNDDDRDAFWHGDSDPSFLALIKSLGWMDDLVANAHLLCESSQKMISAATAMAGNNNDIKKRSASTELPSSAPDTNRKKRI
jgi:NAD-dependent SIR2 family protein deacetylase